MKTWTLKKIESPKSKEFAEDIVRRLYELGLRPGIQIQVIGQISFKSVTIIQYGETRLALNELEMSCLHGH